GPGLARNGDAVERRDFHSVQIDLLRSFPYPGSVEITWLTPIFHPNIREQDGIVCIQLINEWAAGQTIASVVNALKQLLKNPNPHDPLNRDAANYFIAHPDALSASAPAEVKKPRIVM
ncbi:MAG: ubiquitin-conjugating enzyme E2, partial [Candidatus Micrarchaeota archaeon]